MFENQTEEEEEEVIFERDNIGYWCTLQEGKSDNQSQLQELQTIQVVFLYALQWCKFC